MFEFNLFLIKSYTVAMRTNNFDVISTNLKKNKIIIIIINEFNKAHNTTYSEKI